MSVADAAWNVIVANPLWVALQGDLAGLSGFRRNVVWRHFFDPPGHVEQTREQHAEFWAAGAIGPHTSSRKLIHHPQVGTMELDCDVLTVPGGDLRIVAYSAEPGTDAADRLALLAVVGQQSFVG